MKIYKSILIISLLLSALNIHSQNQSNINPDLLKSFSEKYNSNPANAAIENAIRNNSLKDLAFDNQNSSKFDNYFKYKVSNKGITNQKKSGRCWMFTGLNVIRPHIIQKYNLNDFQFSHTYLFFYDQLEKSNLFLEGIIENADKDLNSREIEWFFKNPIGDGGQWTGVVDLIEKYGIVPANVVNETYSAENTSEMSRLIKEKLREHGLKLLEMSKNGSSEKDLRKEKENQLAEIYQILALTLGEPVQEFEWRYKDAEGNLSELKKYTPLSFYQEFIDMDLSEYVMFMDDPRHEYNKLYEVKYDRHQYEGNNWTYVNLPMEQIKKYALASIKDNNAMYMSCDVGKQLNMDDGILDVNNYDYESLLSLKFNMDKKDRINTFQSASSHGMALMAVDTDENNNTTKWMVENSWGMKGFKGHLIISDEWFDEYVFRLVIHKKYLDEEVLKVLEQKPVLLPQWDIMF